MVKKEKENIYTLKIMPNKITAEVQSVKQRFSIIGNSPQLSIAIERALQVAPIDLSVLIIGESGAGKEFFPKIIHTNSARKHSKYIAVNCGAIPEGTIDSELFGHEKGSFTGATSDRKGYFEEVNGGTIFLDEVAELPLTTQARLLRVLESGEYMRVGSSEVKKTDIRVVAATNKDMLKAVKEGKFREDLYYRLSTVQINIPSLRERGDDIWLLTRKFSHDFADNHHMDTVEFSDEAKQTIMGYSWPGNVRQLKNVIEQISLFEAGRQLTRDDIRRYLPKNELVVVDEQSAKFSYDMERGVIFKMISQLQHEIERLKETFASGQAPHINSDVAELMRETKDLIKLSGGTTTHRLAVQEYSPVEGEHIDVEELPIDPVETDNVRPVKTLEDTERETITRALQRNSGRRKKTADELNISERTLYRKIKEYGLEKRNQKKSESTL